MCYFTGGLQGIVTWIPDPVLLGEFQDLAGETLLKFNVDTWMALGGVHTLVI